MILLPSFISCLSYFGEDSIKAVIEDYKQKVQNKEQIITRYEQMVQFYEKIQQIHEDQIALLRAIKDVEQLAVDQERLRSIIQDNGPEVQELKSFLANTDSTFVIDFNEISLAAGLLNEADSLIVNN